MQSLSFTSTDNGQKGGFAFANSFSVFFRFYPTTAHNDGVAHMFCIFDGGSGKLFFADKNSSNAARFGWNNGGTAKFHSIAAGSYPWVQNGWNSWLYSYDNGSDSSKFWANGTFQSTVTTVSAAIWGTSLTTFYIGNYTDGSQPVSGRLSSLTIWDVYVDGTQYATALNNGTPAWRIQTANLKWYAPLHNTDGRLWQRQNIGATANTGVGITITGTTSAGGPPVQELTRPGGW